MYPYGYVYRGKRTVLIWQTGEGDTFRKTSENGLLQSPTLPGMKKMLRSDKARVHWSEYSEMDCDRFWTALINLKTDRASSIIICTILLNGWNFIEDMCRTFELKKEMKRLRTRLLNKAYHKIFYGTNVLALKGKSYNPLWKREEIASLRGEFRTVWMSLRKQGYIHP